MKKGEPRPDGLPYHPFVFSHEGRRVRTILRSSSQAEDPRGVSMSKYGSVDGVRKALEAALTEVASALSAEASPGQSAGIRSNSLTQPSAQLPPRTRSRSGARAGLQLVGQPQLVGVKVELEEVLRRVDAYDGLAIGQVATVPARRAALEQLKHAIASLQQRAKAFQLSKRVQSALAKAHQMACESWGMLDHLNTMYGGGGNDPQWHWRMLSGLIGGYSASFEQSATPRMQDQVWTQGLTPIRLMEALTPDRTFVGNWSRLIGDWLNEIDQGTTQEPFLLWYEGRQQGRRSGANYFSDAVRQAALVTLQDGKLHQLAPSGDGGPPVRKPLTTAAFHGSEVYDMYMAYCLDEFGVLYVYPHKEGAGFGLVSLANKRLSEVAGEDVTAGGSTFHSSGNRGQPVAGAGMIWAADGVVVGISTKSGHYWPSIEMFLQTLEFLGPALGNGVAYFDFMWEGSLSVASCPARDFLRIGKAGFPPGEVSEVFQFGSMDDKTGAIEITDYTNGVFEDDTLKECAVYFLDKYSRFSMNETRRILEERRLAQRTRLGIYRGRTLSAALYREWERDVMMKKVATGKENAFLDVSTPFDQTPLDNNVAARHQARIAAAGQGRVVTRQRSNNFKRYS